MLVYRPHDTESEAFKPPERAQDGESADPESDLFCFQGMSARREDEVVQKMRQHKNGEIEGWKLCKEQV